ncbi:MAG: PHA/PHB synthase family protein [Dehalococcoidia bacterium]
MVSPTQPQPATDETTAADAFARGIRQLGVLNEFNAKVAASFFPEVAQLLSGRSERAPEPKDWRFQHKAWRENPFFRSLAQTYVAWSDAVTRAAESVEASDWRERERLRLGASVLTSTFAPTNSLFTNPAALEKAVETGGASLRRGAEQFRADRDQRRSIPVQVDSSGFEVGKNLAVTPGAVVYRTALFEIIQYAPTTPTVGERPLLIVPPPIGKYYFLDLAPGRSLVEYAVSQGLQVFMLSWRNPGPTERDWSLDTYAGGIVEATGVVRDVAGSPDLNVLGFCAGGIVLATALNHLAAIGDNRVNAASFGVMLLDFEEQASIGAFSPATVLDTARNRSEDRGVLPAADLANVFAWLRPNDLVWNYWVNNYLMGEAPPANDIMAWNADGTNLPAALHQDFLAFFGTNALATGGVTVLGSEVDLSKVTCDTYFMGAVNDHLTPWKACFRSSQLFGGDRTFALSNAGHIAGLVNPPGNPKARHFVGRSPDGDPETWLAEASNEPGTWWTHWANWVSARSGEQRPAPAALGNAGYAALEPAPGRYVHVTAGNA